MTARELISKCHLTVCGLVLALALGSHAALAQTSTMVPTTMSASTMSGVTKKIGTRLELPFADKFKTAAAAQARCPSDTVVWANLPSKVFHVSGSRYFGKTKHGVYACETDAKKSGFKAAKS